MKRYSTHKSRPCKDNPTGLKSSQISKAVNLFIGFFQIVVYVGKFSDDFRAWSIFFVYGNADHFHGRDIKGFYGKKRITIIIYNKLSQSTYQYSRFSFTTFCHIVKVLNYNSRIP